MCMYTFCNVWLCVCVGFIMTGYVYVWVCVYGFFSVWGCVCMGFVMCVCVCVCVGVIQ